VAAKKPRREYPDEFKREAVQMLLDGLKPKVIAERLGLAGPNLLYGWKRQQLERSGPVASSLEARVRELESELHRVERERDILKKALAIFGRHE
jgi:transposase